MVKTKLLVYSDFTPQLDPPWDLLISVIGTIIHARAQAKVLGMTA